MSDVYQIGETKIEYVAKRRCWFARVQILKPDGKTRFLDKYFPTTSEPKVLRESDGSDAVDISPEESAIIRDEMSRRAEKAIAEMRSRVRLGGCVI